MSNLTISNQLLSTINRYYSNDEITPELLSDEIRRIIDRKIIQLDSKQNTEWELLKNWNLLVDKVSSLGFHSVENMSYLNFPNFHASFQTKQSLNDIEINRNLVICISLLTNHYTYYYEYRHRVNLESGSLGLNKIIFFKESKFKTLMPSYNKIDLGGVIESIFQAYQYVSHFKLLTNWVSNHFPHTFSNFEENPRYSMYEYLFDNNTYDFDKVRNVFI